MGKWSFSCRINLDQAAYFKELLADFSVRSIANGYLAEIEIDEEHPSDDGYADAVVTLFMDEETIAENRGAKRGPKFKPTKITVEEMVRLKESGMSPKEIAGLAGIGVATYFRRMAAYRDARY